MPWTAATFLVGAVAICGLPPLNGFVSEFMVYTGALRGQVGTAPAASVPALLAIGTLALIGGLALACFTKAFGVVFLGAPRTPEAAEARSPSAIMVVPMVLLAAACLGIGLAAPRIVEAMAPVLAGVTRQPLTQTAQLVTDAGSSLSSVVLLTAGFLVCIAVIALVRRWLLAGRTIGVAGTWDCGYAAPTPRMQYTASSFAEPLTTFFGAVLRSSVRVWRPQGLFPVDASFDTETEDLGMRAVFRPLLGGVSRALSKLQWIQHGRVNYYVMYIAVTSFALFAWFVLSAD
jgi:NADH:ubiquinone oxidoreductase subunit 5 (subunit L)/multisubunit Na+/H+ antiporter MnhA subunit